MSKSYKIFSFFEDAFCNLESELLIYIFPSFFVQFHCNLNFVTLILIIFSSSHKNFSFMEFFHNFHIERIPNEHQNYVIFYQFSQILRVLSKLKEKVENWCLRSKKFSFKVINFKAFLILFFFSLFPTFVEREGEINF